MVETDTCKDFIPNNDKNPIRKARIIKAQERGAIWVKEWRDGITHIITDKDLHYKDIMSHLKLTSLPVSRCGNHITYYNG